MHLRVRRCTTLITDIITDTGMCGTIITRIITGILTIITSILTMAVRCIMLIMHNRTGQCKVD
ncbi:MAG: hypothetical protein M3N30_03980 [Bacteroidota bacterium]|nr:hypothetical protein [Bacteroidota bacterium]